MIETRCDRTIQSELSYLLNWEITTLLMILNCEMVTIIYCYCLVILNTLMLMLRCSLYLLSVLYAL